MTASNIVYHYDLTPLLKLDRSDPVQLRLFYDTTQLVVTLQGLVNRDASRLYLRYNEKPDDFWWELWQKRWPKEQGAKPTIISLDSLDSLLETFSTYYSGAVVWDENVPATSNLAATVAGIENLLSLRYDENPKSLYQELVNSKKLLAITRSFVKEDGSSVFVPSDTIFETNAASTGSAKNDAYRWLIENYVTTGKTNSRLLGYYLDGYWLKCSHIGWPVNHTLTNLDYFIANKAAIWDLNVWPDESPIDDPNQKPGTDLDTLKMLLRACYDRNDPGEMIHSGGFTPWRYKYTTVQTDDYNAGGKRDGVATEWETVEILSCYNAYLDADALDYASMVNASFFQHWPLEESYSNSQPTRDELIADGLLDEEGRVIPRNYYAHFVGDYDAAAWMYWNLPEFWTDEARGEIPLSWAFNPNLAKRFPLGMDWVRATATDKDSFVTGDSGAGYVNPYHLSEPRLHSNLPSGWTAWESHCNEWMKKLSIDCVGFVLDGNTPNMKDEGFESYSHFATGGVVLHRNQRESQGIHAGLLYTSMKGDLPQSISEAGERIADNFKSDFPSFNVFRSVLRSPTWYKEVERELANKDHGESLPYRLVDIPTLLQLVKFWESQRGESQVDVSEAGKLYSSPDEASGLYPVEFEGHSFRIQHVGDGAAWLLPASPEPTMLYLRTSREYSGTFPEGAALNLKIHASHGTEFEVQFLSNNDSPCTVYKPSESFNSGQWEELSIAFGKQVVAIDGTMPVLRILKSGGELLIRHIEIVQPANAATPGI